MLAAIAGRILLYGLLVMGLVAAFTFLYLQSHDFELLLTGKITDGLAEALGQPVSLQSLRFDLLGGRVMIKGLKIGAGASGFPDPVKIDYVILQVDQPSVLQGILDLKRIILLQPTLNLVYTADGRSNLPQLQQTESAGAMEVRIGSLDVYNGELIFSGQAIGWGMDSGKVNFNLRQTADGAFRGDAELKRLRFVLPGMKPFSADLGMSFTAADNAVSGSARLRGDYGSRLFVDNASYDFASGDATAELQLDADLGLLNIADVGPVSGWLEATGSISFTGGRLEAEAETLVPRLRIADFRCGSLRNKLTFSGDELRCEEFEADLLGGHVGGAFAVARIFEAPVVTARLNAERIDITEALRTAGLEEIQIRGLLDGSFSLALDMARPEEVFVGGDISTAWEKGTERAYKEAVAAVGAGRDLEIFSRTYIPIALSGHLEYSDGALRLGENFTARTPLSEGTISGLADSESLSLVLRTRSVGSDEVALALTNLSRILGLDQGSPQEQYPIASIVRSFETSGQAVLRLSGRLDNPEADLRIRASGVRYMGRDFGSGTMRMEWAGGELRFPQIRLRDGLSTLDMQGKVTFPQGRAAEAEFNIDFAEFNLAGLETLAGLEPLGLTGIGEGQLAINIGTEFTGGGKVKVRSLRFRDISLDHAEAEITFGERLTLQNLDAVGPDGLRIQGNVEYDTVSEDWRASLRANGIRLDKYAELLAPGSRINGTADVNLDANGHRLAAAGLLDFSIAGAEVGGQELGDVRGRLRADGSKAALSITAGGKDYTINAELLGERQDEISLELENDSIDLSALAQEFMPDTRLYLQVSGGASARLKFLESGFEAELRLGKIQAGLEQFSAGSEGPVTIRYSGDRIYLSEISIDQGIYKLNVAGSVGLADPINLNFKLDGSLNLVAFSDFLPDFSFSGGAVFEELNIRGTVEKPLINGSVRVTDGFVRHKESNLSLSNVQGELRIENERIEIGQSKALFSGGEVTLDGFVVLDLAALLPADFQFNIEGTGMNLSLPRELDAVVDSSLIMRGNLQDAVLTGEIDIRSALYTKRFDPEAEILRAQQQLLPIAAEELRNIRLDLALRGEDDIRVDNNLADMEVIVDLQIVGTAAEPVITGRTEVREGQVYYRDRRYTITSGVIDFVNPYRIEPHFDFRAETQVKEYRIFLEFHGTLDRLYPTLSSDPAESTIDILHLLAVGKVRANPFPSDTERLQEQLLGLALSGFITRQVTGELEQRAERLFGVDRLRIDPFFSGGSNSLSPRVTVGEQITDSFSVIYSRNLSKNADQVLVFEYQLSPTMILIGSREEDGSYAIDIHLKHSFR